MGALLSATIPLRPASFNPDEEHMGSTHNGIAGSAHLTGPALPQDMDVNRDGGSRVGISGRS
jgi:hypothetical protein